MASGDQEIPLSFFEKGVFTLSTAGHAQGKVLHGNVHLCFPE